MTEQELKSVLTVALLAAFCDSEKDEAERVADKRIAEALALIIILRIKMTSSF